LPESSVDLKYFGAARSSDEVLEIKIAPSRQGHYSAIFVYKLLDPKSRPKIGNLGPSGH
jgi:hypothetical protein